MAIEDPEALEDLPNSAPRFVGRPIDSGVEDPALLTGRTEFIDNSCLPRMLHCAILRSPLRPRPHHLRRLQRGRRAAGGGRRWSPATTRSAGSSPRPTSPEGWGTHCLATDKVRFVGEPVAAVAAVSRYVAEDALELIDVEYEPLARWWPTREGARAGEPAALRGATAATSCCQRVFTWGEVDAAFARRTASSPRSFRWNRLGANPLETFGVISSGISSRERHLSRQLPVARSSWRWRARWSWGFPPTRCASSAIPHGGSFGGKGGHARHRHHRAAVAQGGRPSGQVDRGPHGVPGRRAAARPGIATTTPRSRSKRDGIGDRPQGQAARRSRRHRARAAASSAPPSRSRPSPGCYAIPAAQYDLTIVATNKLPGEPVSRDGSAAAQLGARADDGHRGARALAIDPAEIRRRNFIPAERSRTRSRAATSTTAATTPRRSTRCSRWRDYRAARAGSRPRRAEQGRYLGIGVVNTIEPGVFDWNAYAIVGQPGIGVPEGATVGIDIFGKVDGQGRLRPRRAGAVHGRRAGARRLLRRRHGRRSRRPLGHALGAAALRSGRQPARRRHHRRRARRRRAAQGEADQGRGRALADPARARRADGRRDPGQGHAEARRCRSPRSCGTMLARSDLLPPGVDPSPEATYVWTAPGRTLRRRAGPRQELPDGGQCLPRGAGRGRRRDRRR